MANEQNLRPSEYKLSQEEQKRGGIASGKARREKATLKKAMQVLLNETYTDRNGKEATGAEILVTSMFKIASNTKDRNAVNAFRAILELTGEAKVPDAAEEAELNKLDELLEQVRQDAIQR